jgi:UDP-3-O-[3-hydroxymyristoyl] N-acetylglucosamine deacetylase
MNASQKQHTLRDVFRFEGIGLHTGNTVVMEVCPAPENHGIRLLRVDLDSASAIPALASAVSSTTLCTLLGQGQNVVGTVEHVLASLSWLGVDNALVKINAGEIPIADGSAGLFADGIAAIGLVEQHRERKFLRLTRAHSLERGTARLRATPCDRLEIHYHVEYPVASIGRQDYSFVGSLTGFAAVCDARTFCLQRDIDAMRARGLAKGGSLENAVVASEQGILNPEGLRYPDEMVRHKVLDALGDFSLLGAPLLARVEVSFGGHGLHVDFCRELLACPDLLESVSSSKLGPSTDGLMSGSNWPNQAARLRQRP